jgi:hypothetical protein
MEFRHLGNGGNSGGCSWIAAEGDITDGTPEKFEQFLIRSEIPTLVYIHSDGGDMWAGLEMGRIIRRHGLSTAVGKSVPDEFGWYRVIAGKCASCAAYAFIGGVTRDAEADEIGVHQFYVPESLDDPDEPFFSEQELRDSQAKVGDLIEYTWTMGVDPRFVAQATATEPEDLHFFSEDELNEFRIRWQPKEFLPWTIEPFGSGAIASTMSRDKTLGAQMFRTGGRTCMRLRSDLFEDEEWMETALPLLGSIEVYKHFVPGDGVALTQVPSRDWWELRVA